MVLNTTTGFYRHAYEPAMNDHPGAWAVMETILNAVMYAEADPMLTEAQQAFQTRVRPMIGRITSMMCTTLDMSVAQPPPSVDVRTKRQVVEDLAARLDLDVPPRSKGSSVRVELLQGIAAKVCEEVVNDTTKPGLYRAIMAELSPGFDASRVLSTGGTITLEGLIALDEAVLKTHGKR